jgi:hypothetical protein
LVVYPCHLPLELLDQIASARITGLNAVSLFVGLRASRAYHRLQK